MVCSRCGALSPEGSPFCFNCGAALAGGPESAAGVLARLPDTSWWLVLLLDVATFGLYGPAWFLRRLDALDPLGPPRLHAGLLWAGMLGRVAILLASIWGHQAAATPPMVDGLQGFLGTFVFVLMAHQALVLRRLLKNLHQSATGKPLAAGWLWTVLFQEIALQRTVNRIRERL